MDIHSRTSLTYSTVFYNLKCNVTSICSSLTPNTYPRMNSGIAFEPRCASTPKRMSIASLGLNLCSTPRPGHVRYSLAKCTPLPIHCSTPNTKKTRKSLAPNLQHLIYPGGNCNQSAMKIWVL